MFKKSKWEYLTIHTNKEKCTVPIFNASAKGKCIPLLKTLLSSHCANDCKFCAFRRERKTRRERWGSNELANIAMKLWKSHKIQGVFLSSSVDKDPDFVVEKEIETIRILRNRGFNAYCHLRLMPSVSKDLIKQAVQLSDRVGINIEFPSTEHYNDMKLFLDFKQDIIKRVRMLAHEIKKVQAEGKCKAGLDTQMVVGASDETDKEILKIADWMYNKMSARRVYFSAFDPVKETPLENKPPENRWREYRLYQSSFLIQKYDFKRKDLELALDSNDMLSLKYDPKYIFAVKNEISVNVNSATFEELIKVPGIGPDTANRILESRGLGARFNSLKELKNAGVIVKRAMPFIGINSHQTRLSDFRL